MEEVLDQFLACVPLRDLQWKNMNFSTDCQNELIKKIFENQLVARYPPRRDYQLSFLKSLMKQVENNDNEVIEQLYEIYGKLIGSPPDSDYCYKSYNLADYGYITLKESIHLISKGTTGLHSWQAAFHLTEWVMEHTDIFKSKHILEIGSGSGFLGLALCRVCIPHSYTFTDCDDNVLQLLKDNVKINEKKYDESCVIKVERLDWTSPNHIVTDSCYDIVIASDIVYDTELVDVLVQMLKTIFSVQLQTIVIIASTIRNEDTYKYFLRALDKILDNVTQCICDPPVRQRFFYDRSTNIQILQLCVQT